MRASSAPQLPSLRSLENVQGKDSHRFLSLNLTHSILSKYVKKLEENKTVKPMILVACRLTICFSDENTKFLQITIQIKCKMTSPTNR